MPRRRTAKNVPISPWMSAQADRMEKRFLQVGISLMESDAVHKLTPAARWLYLAMAMESYGKPEVTFTHGTAKKYGISGTTFDRRIGELCENGFVERVQDPALMQYSPAVFRVSLVWKSIKSAPQSGEG